eukprot:CAMPEP_0178392474 /NCGR_PEP_ID=MMETSP0689_2-20121128/11697_1 /TAXON_ID=160604 /ORGANISM="Amphidinium massartii, Strain CS-259" /LENGTH=1032 /DNA_ID=CAMNT_0020013049 /DNA_START=87 /DNA_END=3182 /DNA_ORIENTATION=+
MTNAEVEEVYGENGDLEAVADEAKVATETAAFDDFEAELADAEVQVAELFAAEDEEEAAAGANVDDETMLEAEFAAVEAQVAQLAEAEESSAEAALSREMAAELAMLTAELDDLAQDWETQLGEGEEAAGKEGAALQLAEEMPSGTEQAAAGAAEPTAVADWDAVGEVDVPGELAGDSEAMPAPEDVDIVMEGEEASLAGSHLDVELDARTGEQLEAVNPRAADADHGDADVLIDDEDPTAEDAAIPTAAVDEDDVDEEPLAEDEDGVSNYGVASTAPVKKEPMHIDGSLHDGGGQLLRLAATYSVLLGNPVSISSIRANRKRPGLASQHITALRTLQDICQGCFDEGSGIGSTEITFTPGPLIPGQYTARLGGSAALTQIVQTLLYPLLFTGGTSTCYLTGGTDVDFGPSFDFLTGVLQPTLARMGVRFRVECLTRGFFPGGGGRVVLKVDPQDPGTSLKALDLQDPGKPLHAQVVMYTTGRLEPLERAWATTALEERVKAVAPRTDVLLEVVDGPEGSSEKYWLDLVVTTTSGARFHAGARPRDLPRRQTSPYMVDADVGNRMKELVGKAVGQVCDKIEADVNSGVAVDEHLLEQLILPATLAQGKSRFLAPRLSSQALAAIAVAQTMVPGAIMSEVEKEGSCLLEVQGIGYEAPDAVPDLSSSSPSAAAVALGLPGSGTGLLAKAKAKATSSSGAVSKSAARLSGDASVPKASGWSKNRKSPFINMPSVMASPMRAPPQSPMAMRSATPLSPMGFLGAPPLSPMAPLGAPLRSPMAPIGAPVGVKQPPGSPGALLKLGTVLKASPRAPPTPEGITFKARPVQPHEALNGRASTTSKAVPKRPAAVTSQGDSDNQMVSVAEKNLRADDPEVTGSPVLPGSSPELAEVAVPSPEVTAMGDFCTPSPELTESQPTVELSAQVQEEEQQQPPRGEAEVVGSQPCAAPAPGQPVAAEEAAGEEEETILLPRGSLAKADKEMLREFQQDLQQLGVQSAVTIRLDPSIDGLVLKGPSTGRQAAKSTLADMLAFYFP